MEWAEILKQGGLAAAAGLLFYLLLREMAARDKERDAATARYDALLAILLKHMPDSIKSDFENVAALKGVEGGLGGMRSILDLIARKVGV